MPIYSNASEIKLLTCEKDLQILFNEVIKYFDNTIIYGQRTPEEQLELFEKGRLKLEDRYIITDKKKVVTNCDGYKIKSNHNYSPSRAVDSLPYPINGKDYKRMYYYAGFVMGLAKKLKEQGLMKYDLRWGGDWNNDNQVIDNVFNDLAHFELIM